MFKNGSMTRLSRSRSLKQDQKWTVTNVQMEKLEKPQEVDKIPTKPNVDNESFLDELSSWSLEDDKDIDNKTGRLSSLTSWGSDDFEFQTTQIVSDYFAKIDSCLYENISLENENLNQECRDWAERFPHIRVTGTKIFPADKSHTSTAKQYARPPSATLAQSSGRKSSTLTEEEFYFPENYEEIFAHHSSDSQSDNKSSSASQKSLLVAERPISPSNSFREQAVDALFDAFWPEIIPILEHVIRQYKNTKKSAQIRRSSDPEMEKRRRSVMFDRETADNEKSRKIGGANKLSIASKSSENMVKRVPSPHYMLPTVASKNSKNPTNLISGNYKNRVISAAIHRQPRRLMPINVDVQHQNVNVKSKQSTDSAKHLITARLPPIDLNLQFPNMPKTQRPISSYSTKSLKSLLPFSRSYTNEALFEETDEDDQNSLQSALIISPYTERKRVTKNDMKTKKKSEEFNESKTEEFQRKPNKKLSFPF